MGVWKIRERSGKSVGRMTISKTICAFANTEGGILKIGVDDEGNPIGVNEPEKLLKMLPDKIRSRLGIVPSVDAESEKPPYVVSVHVKKSPSPVSLDGRFYVRSGSTTQMITGRELESYMMDRIGESWTEIPVPGVTAADLEPEAITQFKNLGIDSGRITAEEGSMDREDLMEKLGLVKDGMLNRAAVLLFHSNPGKILGPVSLKIGMFDGSDILYQA